MCEVGLLVEAGFVETERVDNIDDGLGTVLNTFVGLLGGRVGADVEVLGTEGYLLAVGLVNGAADLLEVVRVGDELVAGDDVLRGRTGVLAIVVWQSRKPWSAGSCCGQEPQGNRAEAHTLKMIILNECEGE